MRILFVNKFAHVTGGADRHVLDLARLLRDEGHVVALLSTASAENVEASGRFVTLRVSAATRRDLPLAARMKVAASALWNPEAAEATARLIDELKPDIVHAHKLYPQLSVAPVVVAARRGIPVVQTAHDYEFVSANPIDSSGSRLDRQEEMRAFRLLNDATFLVRRMLHRPRTAVWIAVSEALAAAYRAHGIDPLVIRNFSRLDGAPPAPRESREGVVYVGRLAPEKGTGDVIEAARLLPKVRVTVAGMGPDAALVSRATAELPNLRFLGRLGSDETLDVLRRAAVALMPARWDEPGPLAAIEAMGAGTPIVAFDRGGLAEYVRRSGGGVVVPSTPDALASACAELLRDDEQWHELSARGAAAAASEHSPATYLSRLTAAYELAREITTTGD